MKYTSKNRKLLIKIGCAMMMFLICFTAYSVFAQQSTYTLLEPIPGGTAKTTGSDFSTYLQDLFRFIVSMAIIASVVMLALAGVEYSASGASEAAKKDATERIWNTVTGLLLALTAYLILNVINPDLVKFNLYICPVGTDCTTGKPISQAGGAAVSTATGSGTGTQEINSTARAAANAANTPVATYSNKSAVYPGDEKAIRTALGSHFTYNSDVKLEGVGKDAITGLVDTQNLCNCDININSGLDGNHKSHGVGKNIVDLRYQDGSGLNNYITSNATGVPYAGCATLYTMSNGDQFRYEPAGCLGSTGPHFHAIFATRA
jgi:hypothetical protein